jgi:hypothetical protein
MAKKMQEGSTGVDVGVLVDGVWCVWDGKECFFPRLCNRREEESEDDRQ